MKIWTRHPAGVASDPVGEETQSGHLCQRIANLHRIEMDVQSLSRILSEPLLYMGDTLALQVEVFDCGATIEIAPATVLGTGGSSRRCSIVFLAGVLPPMLPRQPGRCELSSASGERRGTEFLRSNVTFGAIPRHDLKLFDHERAGLSPVEIGQAPQPSVG